MEFQFVFKWFILNYFIEDYMLWFGDTGWQLGVEICNLSIQISVSIQISIFFNC